MNTFLKIAIGFVSGIICTIVGLYIIGMQNSEELQLREEVRISALKNLKKILDNTEESEITNEEETPKRNIQFFELSTKKGVVKLHTYMSKDSVQLLMGRPQLTDVDVYDFSDEVHETWEYKGRNKHFDEFTMKFINGELVSVDQYKESYYY